ncbi:MAG TPA: hypothetical protein K8V56_12105 [Sporosarcina psychrophila]|uniref:Uncharacterized protein n=1 Tax=Sporosarcina psychrophila TaxID=1476 RepID=A0A921KDU5_SPOPS|nr:hypothetical protein [Sporosarcina psychrophila]
MKIIELVIIDKLLLGELMPNPVSSTWASAQNKIYSKYDEFRQPSGNELHSFPDEGRQMLGFFMRN